MSNPSVSSRTEISNYAALHRRVKEILLEGRRRIEAEKVRTYWEAGRLIQEHILLNADRAEYGGEVVARLSKDIGMSASVLHRCVKFAQKYPDYQAVAARPQFTWTHYRTLITVDDDNERSRVERQADKAEFSARELEAYVQAERPPETAGAQVNGAAEAAVIVERRPRSSLAPICGALYTYRIVRRKVVLSSGGSFGQAPGELVVDLGFSCYRDVEARYLSLFAEDDIVESRPRDDVFRFFNTDRTSSDLYTYEAFAEHVVDGGTIKLHIDLGFSTWTRQTVRLRGIDCPERGTRAGDAARSYVQSLIKENCRLMVRSSRSNKHDHYFADVFLPAAAGEGEFVFLNDQLLQKGHASLWSSDARNEEAA